MKYKAFINKILLILMITVFSFSFTACNKETTERKPPQDQTNIVENDMATFSIHINTITMDDSNSVVTVVVKITTKVVINQTLETSSYGDEGLIRIRIVSVDNEDILLYSEFYDIPFTDDEYDVNLNIGEELTRTIQFARMPFHGGAGGELPSPTGVYKVQVSLFSPEMIWIDTELFITVE